MKSEIETLVEKIYHAQTYGKDCDKLIENLNRLTAVNKPTKAAKKLIDRKQSLLICLLCEGCFQYTCYEAKKNKRKIF